MAMNPRAYSYLRFSTPEQMRGDSFRRQADASQHYATTHGLDLDTVTTFQDLGVSAFRGRNVKEGALGQFIAAVEAGSIAPGSFLLVESLDRLSRQAVNRAFLQFQAIVDSGITVVTLQDGKVYTRESLNENFGDLMFSLAVMFRANEESTTKSKRLRAAWGAKRKRAADGNHKLTSVCPAWLVLDRPSGTFVALKDRAVVVRRIFAMTLAGHGKSTIAQTFNREGVPTFGRSSGWHPSYVQKILDSEAVYGTFQPMRLEQVAGRRKRTPDGDPVAGYFPAVVTRETFLQAHRLRQGRKIESGRKGARFSNLFTGIAKCGQCGAPMHYVNKGNSTKGGSYLVCSNARRGVGLARAGGAARCTNPAWRYRSVEGFVLLGLLEVDYLELFPKVHKSTRERLDSLARTRLGKEADLEKIKQQADNIVTLLAERPDSPAFKDKLRALEETSGALEGELSELAQQIDAEDERLRTVEQDYKQTQSALAALAKGMRGDAAKVFDLRSRLHQLLKRALSSITFVPKRGDTHGDIEIAFAGTDAYRRVLRLEAGQTRGVSFKIVGGKREQDGPYMELHRKPPVKVPWSSLLR